MDSVDRPASAIRTSGSPPVPPAYHRLVKPSDSASVACSITRSVVFPPPLIPIRIATEPTEGRTGSPDLEGARGQQGAARRRQLPGVCDQGRVGVTGVGAMVRVDQA